MTEPPPVSPIHQSGQQDEIARLKKIVGALMDRAERSASVQGSDFGLFQTAVLLEQQVRQRTEQLQAASRANEKVTRDLRESEARFRGVVSQSLVGIVLIEGGKLTYANAKFAEMFGYAPDTVLGMAPSEFVVPSDRDLVAGNIGSRERGSADRVEYTFHGLRLDGSIIDVEAHGGVMDVGGRRILISMLMDITSRTRAERDVQILQEKLREQSVRDALTGLYNRRYLEESLAREIALADRAGHPVSVIMCDLDHFKAVNDKWGHLAGDAVLRVCGGLLNLHVRASDICCRYGGEEFVLVLPGLVVTGAADRAEQLRSAIAETPVDYHGQLIRITASFGVAVYPSDGADGDTLIAAADRALYGAKSAGRNRVEVAGTSATARR